MRYVIIRDDDTNAFTPVECLDRLYRPFLSRGLPVNLAAIPSVSTSATMGNGQPEGFLVKMNAPGARAHPHTAASQRPAHWERRRPRRPLPLDSPAPARAPALPVGAVSGCAPGVPGPASAPSNPLDLQPVGAPCVQSVLEKIPGELRPDTPEEPDPRATVPISENQRLVCYLRENPGYHIAQHGCHHDYLEFDRPERVQIGQRLNEGTRLLLEAGFKKPEVFVAPYDKLSRASFLEVAARFRVVSTGWFELGRLPYSWWPRYAFKKFRKIPHWRMGRTLLLSHPGCLLSCHHAYATMLGAISHYLETQQLTVLVTHWWEYFRDGEPDEPFIDLLHETSEFLATHRDLKVISFEDLLEGEIKLN